jgi:DNA-directed RNA polymerase subunit RPC12/RpoP
MTIRTFSLKVITAPAIGYAIQAPPPIAVSANTNHYLCGHCDTLLVIADAGQLHGLVVRCRECGHYNAVDT